MTRVLAKQLVLGATILWGASLPAGATPASDLDSLADRYVAAVMDYDPSVSYIVGVPTTDHSRFLDRSPAGRAAWYDKEIVLLNDLAAIDAKSLPPQSRATYAVLKEQLEADLQMRVCKAELWNVNHFAGWHSDLANIADNQPIGTPAARAEALKRWSTFAHFVDVEIDNLREGLRQGYAAPKTVTARVIEQMKSLAAAAPTDSPYFSPAKRDEDAQFKTDFAKLIADSITPALERYRDFLINDYLPKARDNVALSELPDGAACYQANLRYNTTLNRTPQEVFDLGTKAVEKNVAEAQAIGERLFGTKDIVQIAAKTKEDKANRFTSRDELLAYSRDLLERAREKTASLVSQMPKQVAIIEPERDFEEAAGVASHYEPNPDISKPGIYRIQLGNWETQTRGQAAITVVHEAWPGHHLQIALARDLRPDTQITKLAFNSAYVEGWARYAEALSEEAGIYENDYAKITRRVWPARGMVVDPGLHALGWTRKQAVDYLLSSGYFTDKTAETMVDRIAVMPGQLTAYDSGGLEIKALRAQAEAALGNRFNLAAFNKVILEQGVVPLSELRTHVEEWLATQK